MNRMPHPYDDDDLAVFGDANAFGLGFDMPLASFADGPLRDDESPEEALPAAYAGRLDRFLSEVTEEEASLARQAARRARAVEQAREWAMVSDEFVLSTARLSPTERSEWVIRTFVTEVATRLHLPEPSADRLIAESHTLVHELPATLDALSLGTISYRHAVVIIDQAGTLPEKARAAFEEALLDDAARLPVTQFRRRAVKARELMHPESIKDRTRAAVTERRFAFEADQDGMGWLHHYLPVAQALAAFNRVTDLAESLQGADEPRTLAQLRADVVADLLLDGEPTNETTSDEGTRSVGTEDGGRGKRKQRGIRPTVVVTVPVMTLLGQSEEPGSLDGYGPIDPDTARRLAAKAPSFIRLLTHPETGAVLSLGKTRYKIPKDLRTWLEIRDKICRFPGCGKRASHTDIDHTTDWVTGGRTDAANLGCLCKAHHRLKHNTVWSVHQRGGGVLEWRSPTGQPHITTPAVELPGASPPKEKLPSGIAQAPSDADPPPPF